MGEQAVGVVGVGLLGTAVSGVLLEAGHRVVGHDVVAEKRHLLTGTEAEVGAYLQQWRRTAVNRVCEAFERVKKAEVESFGEKSYFYRKSHGIPPAESDDDPDPDPGLDENGEMRAHGFEEPEAEEMDIDVDEAGVRRWAEFPASPVAIKTLDQPSGVVADASRTNVGLVVED